MINSTEALNRYIKTENDILKSIQKRLEEYRLKEAACLKNLARAKADLEMKTFLESNGTVVIPEHKRLI